MSWIDQRPDDAMDGAFTAVGPDPVRTVEPALFREGMSRLGAAMLLVCLYRRSQTNPVVVENGVFCVNTLGDGGAEIADIFAGRTGVAGGERFASGDWLTLSTGSPVLASAVIAFDCRIVEVRSVGSHNVFFGAVETVRLGPSGPALVYHDRAYKRV